MEYNDIKISQTIELDVYNQNHNSVFIDFLAEKQPEHTGVIGDVKKLENSQIVLIRMNMKEGVKQFMFSTFELNKEKYLYINFFSLNQYQDNIMDISLIWDTRKKMLFEMPYKSNAYFTFFPSMRIKDTEKFGQQKFPENKQLSKSLPEYQLSVYVRNKRSSKQTVNIADVINSNTNLDDESIQVKILTRKLPQDKPFEYKNMRIFSKSVEQLHMPIDVGYQRINTSQFFTAYQMQSIGIDLVFETPKTFLEKFEITILPDCEVLYYFL